MKRVKILGGVLLVLCLTQHATAQINYHTISYSANILIALDDLTQNKEVNSDRLLKCIPANEDQYVIFYSFSDADRKTYDLAAWGKLQELFFEKAGSDDKFYTALIKLSNYTDGDYAELFRERFDKMIKQDPDRFCRLSRRVEMYYYRIKEYMNTYCN
ncbi:hypothetical protein [Anseongella ginsenosidimutans]|nr:hypothetical protein [Anseongella ginsenosidimutans]QEC53517.1 hypothetical protein FRZ59_15040 [Anseongella ginsenosidimutans]